ncbi:MAG TPA: TlpA disulfide reductase family protein [Terracidiphilus sp.]|nr:TlpA disulfide reductase family protein [Terracidiphilus sp.]
MKKRRLNLVFVVGVVAPFAAILLYGLVYGLMTSLSRDVERDWGFRLFVAAVAMTVPSILTFVVAFRQFGQHKLSMLSIVGLVLAVLTLGLVAKPAHDGIVRSRQERNMALHDVAAPQFETRDIAGKVQRLSDQKGKIVLINLWATWCAPCRIEMPKLDQLYKDRKDRGLVVFGLSAEDAETQGKFLAKVPVSYPLLTMTEGVPNFYRDVARYPALFLVDRDGQLQPLSGATESFASVEAAVDRLLEMPSH